MASPWASTAFAKEAASFRLPTWQFRLAKPLPSLSSFTLLQWLLLVYTKPQLWKKTHVCKVSRHPARSGGWQKAWKMQFQTSEACGCYEVSGFFEAVFPAFRRWQWVLFLWGGDVGSKSELGVVASTFDSQVGSWVHLPLQRWGRGLQPGNLCHLPGGAPPMFVPRVALAAQHICWNLNALPQDPWSSHLET